LPAGRDTASGEEMMLSRFMTLSSKDFRLGSVEGMISTRLNRYSRFEPKVGVYDERRK